MFIESDIVICVCIIRWTICIFSVSFPILLIFPYFFKRITSSIVFVRSQIIWIFWAVSHIEYIHFTMALLINWTHRLPGYDIDDMVAWITIWYKYEMCMKTGKEYWFFKFLIFFKRSLRLLMNSFQQLIKVFFSIRRKKQMFPICHYFSYKTK